MTVAEPPSLQGVRTLPEGWPKYSLGWQMLGWTYEYALQPDGPQAGQPWDFTDEQARFLIWWYAVDEYGRFIYRYGMLRRMKGWGKDPLGAIICFIEFVGPCRFSHWEYKGTVMEPVAVAHPSSWVQTAAVSKEQTKNTMSLLPGMISDRAIAEFEINPGIELWYAHGRRCQLQAVTSSPRALEGGRSTFVLKNETHHWLASNEGAGMSKVIARNVGKSRDGSGRALAISNAHAPGELSDAEMDYEAYQEYRRTGINEEGMLYDSLEAPEGVDLDDRDQVRYWLEWTRGDSHWCDPERIQREIAVLRRRNEEGEAIRFYFNALAASEARFFNLAVWNALVRHGFRVRHGRKITLGFDGSLTRDWTALIATDVETGFQWPIGIWIPQLQDDGEIRINAAQVDAAVDAAFADYDVIYLYGDPYYWKDEMSAWAGRYNKRGKKRVIEWATTNLRRMAIALLNYRNAMAEGAVSHPGDPNFTAGIANAYKQVQGFTDDQGNPMATIIKERPDSPLKIDPAMAGCLSWDARMTAIADGALKPSWHQIYVPGAAGLDGDDDDDDDYDDEE